MARTPDGLTPRTTRITFRIDEAEQALLDEIRGSTGRSTFLRSLITAEGARHRRRIRDTAERTTE